MADDKTQRSYRAPDDGGRNAPASGNDPLAELARLIGQNDPFGEYGRGAGQGAGVGSPVPAAPEAHVAAEPTAEWAPPPGPVPGYPSRPAQPAPAAYQGQHEPHPAEQPYQDPYQAQPYAERELYQTEDGAYPQHAQPGDYQAYADAGAYAPPQAQPGVYDPAYDDPNAVYAGQDEDYYDDVPPRRRMGILAIAAVFALAVLGTAGAFGYRALFGSSHSGPPPIIKADTKPSKIVPAKKDAMAKLIQDRAPATDKLVAREEKPIDLQGNPAAAFPPDQAGTPAGSVEPPMMGSGVIGSQPRKVHTIVIRPDQLNGAGAGSAAPASQPPATTAAPQEPAVPPVKQVARVAPVTQAHAAPPRQAAVTPKPAPTPRHPVARVTPTRHYRVAQASRPAPGNAPLSLNPDAPSRAAPARSAPMRTASLPRRLAPQATPAAATSGGYAVQLSARRSAADARAAFHSLQAKYPSQLGGRQPLIRRVDLGQKGIYYRAMVGPFSSSDAAKRLCSRLKAAGGRCFVQRI